MPFVNCRICKISFYAKPSWIKNGCGKYCSRICSSSGRKTGKIIPCFLCGKDTYRQLKAIKNSKSGKNFCSKGCALKWHNYEFKENNHGNWKSGEFAYKRILQRSGIKAKCLLCGTSDSRIICVHHVDRNRKNNKLENLSWLCRNCHHLVHKYKDAANKFSELYIKHGAKM